MCVCVCVCVCVCFLINLSLYQLTNEKLSAVACVRVFFSLVSVDRASRLTNETIGLSGQK